MIDVAIAPCEIDVFFSPDDNVQQKLIELIQNETKAIWCASFRMTDKNIIQALLKAHQKGVSIIIVSDQDGISGMHNKLLYLFKEGIAIFVFPPLDEENLKQKRVRNKMLNQALMHNKFFIFHHQKIVTTGSYNYTQAAHLHNQENMVTISHPPTFKKYIKQFEKLLQRSTLLHH